MLTASYSDSPVLVYEKPTRGWQNTSAPNATLNSPSVASFAIGGKTVVVGESTNSNQNSSALIFLEPQGGWEGSVDPTAELVPSDYPSRFGYSVTIDHQGRTIVAAGEVCGLCYEDALYVYVRPSQGWVNATQTAKLKMPHNFGLADVAINEEGETVVAGSPGATVGANQFQGAAYTFSKPHSGWRTTREFSKLTASGGDKNDVFGTSVGVSGNTILVGAPGVSVGSYTDQGLAYVFGK